MGACRSVPPCSLTVLPSPVLQALAVWFEDSMNCSVVSSQTRRLSVSLALLHSRAELATSSEPLFEPIGSLLTSACHTTVSPLIHQNGLWRLCVQLIFIRGRNIIQLPVAHQSYSSPQLLYVVFSPHHGLLTSEHTVLDVYLAVSGTPPILTGLKTTFCVCLWAA